ncbi:MAG: hypothetical protein IRZ00_01430 [Gemmatimonadetes bacterium]|nr:hypothetical protein [Gemmatimonadota bacterium]
MIHLRPSMALLLVGLGLALFPACRRAATGAAGQNEKLDPPLRRMVAERPDSIVGIFVRTVAAPTPEQREALTRAGLAIGSAVGDVVTGRARARAAPRIAALDFVRYLELARTVPAH